MLQDTQSIRYYQRLTDDMVDLWHRGSRFDEIRKFFAFCEIPLILNISPPKPKPKPKQIMAIINPISG